MLTYEAEKAAVTDSRKAKIAACVEHIAKPSCDKHG